MQVALTVRDHLERAALVYGDRVGIIDEPDQPAPPLTDADGPAGAPGTLTYRSVLDRSRALAAGLEALGVEQGGRVAVVSQNAARLLTVLYGAPAWGRIAVPVNFRLQAEEVQYIVEHSGAEVLLVDPELDEALAGVTAPQRYVIGAETDELLYRPDVDPTPWEPDEDATATINYTSGTTARPKGVEMTHRNLWVNAATFGWQAGVSDRDVYLHTLPMFHCNGWGMPYTVAGMGVPQVVLRKVDGAEILRRVERPRRHLHVRRARRGGHDPRGGGDLGRAESRAGTGSGSSWPAHRRPPGPSSGSRPSWAGSSSRSTA